MLKARINAVLEKPIVIYDDHCGFCRQRMKQWKNLQGLEIQFVASDDSLIQSQYPELLRADLQTSVHYIDCSGKIFYGAEAVFLVLKQKWIFSVALWLYRRSSLFARFCEVSYAWIARHRYSLSCFSPNK